MTRYANNFDHTLPFSDAGAMVLLVASTAVAYTVPGTANQSYRAKFSISSTADAWVCLNGTAVLPTSGAATATYKQERIDDGLIKYVKGGDSLSFISSTTPQIGVSFILVQQT